MTILAPLKRLRWVLARSKPTKHESDVSAVVDALASGDEVLARRLAAEVEAHRARLVRADDLGVREHWIAELGAWDGVTPSPDEQAGLFVDAMATFLATYRDHEHAGQAHYFATSPERIDAVARVFERVEAGKRFAKGNPGRVRMSAGLRAMGLDAEALLDFDRKR